MEPRRMDLPAPVSPVRIFSPGPNSTSISSMSARFFTCKCTNKVDLLTLLLYIQMDKYSATARPTLRFLGCPLRRLIRAKSPKIDAHLAKAFFKHSLKPICNVGNAMLQSHTCPSDSNNRAGNSCPIHFMFSVSSETRLKIPVMQTVSIFIFCSKYCPASP